MGEAFDHPKPLCLFCLTEVPSSSDSLDEDAQNEEEDFESATASKIGKQLRTIFIFKMVLDLSDKVLERYLRTSGNPEEWVKLCAACEQEAETLRQIFKQVTTISRKFLNAKWTFQEKLRNTNVPLTGDKAIENWPILNECRRIICQRERWATSSSYINPFVEGDSWAHRLLRNRVNRTEGGLIEDLIFVKQEVDDVGEVDETFSIPDFLYSSDLHGDDVDNPSGAEDGVSNSPEIRTQSQRKDGDKDGVTVGDRTVVHRKRTPTRSLTRRPMPKSVRDRSGNSSPLTGRQMVKREMDFEDDDDDDNEVAANSSDSDWVPPSSTPIHDDVNSEPEILPNDIPGTSLSEPKPKKRKYGPRKIKKSKGQVRSEAHSAKAESGPTFCQHCGKTFKQPRLLASHLLHVHGTATGRIKYPCKVEGCGKVYLDKKQYYAHLRFHEGKGIQCDMCDKVYYLKSELYKHQRRAHKSLTKGSVAVILPRSESERLSANALLLAEDVGEIELPAGDHDPDWVGGPGTEPEDEASSSSDSESGSASNNSDEEGDSSSEKRKKTKKKQSRKPKPVVAAQVRMAEPEKEKPFPCTQCEKRYTDQRRLDFHLFHAHGVDLTDREKYVCSFESCGKIYLDRKQFRAHIRFHQGNGIKCEICGKMYYLRSELSKHLRRSHKMQTTTTANISPKAPVDSSLSLLCDKCGKNFRSPTELEKHRKGKTCGTEFQCIICQVKFLAASDLRAHNVFNHPELKVQEDAVDEVEETSTAVDKSFLCTKCPKSYSTEKSLQLHIQLTHDNPFLISCELCEFKARNKPLLRFHMAQKHDIGRDKLTCPKCQKLCWNENALEKHVCGLTHYVSRKVKTKCPVCLKEFSCKNGMRKHLKGVHWKKYNYNCEICGMGYWAQYELLRHQAAQHGVGEHRCRVEGCNKVFGGQGALDEHVKYTHNKEKRPRTKICSYCGKAFCTNKDIRHHVQAMHSVNREIKPFKCTECGKGFATMAYLLGHGKVHKKEANRMGAVGGMEFGPMM